MIVPNVEIKIKEGPDWVEHMTHEWFKKRRVVLVSIPGAFTPVCSSKQVPAYEEKYSELIHHCDGVIITSVNDSCVMSAWMNSLGIEHLEWFPDGAGEFTRGMNQLVWKPIQNFGYRSWRYAAVIDNCRLEKMFAEEGFNNQGLDDDPYVQSTPEKVHQYLHDLDLKN